MIRFSINNPLLANLLLGLILIIGVLSWQAMPQEMFPNIALDKIRITTAFKGASPEEVEKQITLPIEQEIEGMSDIDTIMPSNSWTRIYTGLASAGDLGAANIKQCLSYP